MFPYGLPIHWRNWLVTSKVTEEINLDPEAPIAKSFLNTAASTAPAMTLAELLGEDDE